MEGRQPMTDSVPPAQNTLALYRQYSDMAHRTSGGISESYHCMARQMLRRAARLDPAAVAEVSAAAMVRMRPEAETAVAI
jgi:hypothetical protein